jgi:hypothetical protein
MAKEVVLPRSSSVSDAGRHDILEAVKPVKRRKFLKTLTRRRRKEKYPSP